MHSYIGKDEKIQANNLTFKAEIFFVLGYVDQPIREDVFIDSINRNSVKR